MEEKRKRWMERVIGGRLGRRVEVVHADRPVWPYRKVWIETPDGLPEPVMVEFDPAAPDTIREVYIFAPRRGA